MTRIAPTLTLLAVAALGGGMYVANATTDPPAQLPVSAPAAAVAPAASPAAAGNGPTQISLAGIPVAGGTGAAAAVGGPTEISLRSVPYVGGPADAPAPGRAEISLADIAVAQPGAASAAAPAAGAPASAAPGSATAFAGDTSDGTMTVAVAEDGGKAVAYVCGGKIEAWLDGSAAGGTLSLQSKSGRSTLTGTGTSGTVTIDGKDFPYTAKATDVATAARNGRADVGRLVARLGQSR